MGRCMKKIENHWSTVYTKRLQLKLFRGIGAVFTLRKFYTEQMFALLRTERMQLRNNVDTRTVKRSQR